MIPIADKTVETIVRHLPTLLSVAKPNSIREQEAVRQIKTVLKKLSKQAKR